MVAALPGSAAGLPVGMVSAPVAAATEIAEIPPSAAKEAKWHGERVRVAPRRVSILPGGLLVEEGRRRGRLVPPGRTILR